MIIGVVGLKLGCVRRSDLTRDLCILGLWEELYSQTFDFRRKVD